MANTTNSTNMNMPIPVVGSDPGPQYASDQNSCFSIIDAHDHTNGNGVPITPSGLNINSDLTFQLINSITNIKKIGMTSQGSALSGTNFLSNINGNLYFNDGSSNQVQITSGGGVAGSPGSIGSLTAPAAATYSAGSKLFTWTASSAHAAAMDNGAVTIRETNVASAKGITLASPSSLGADYQLTLLTGLPGSTQYMSCDSSGNLGTATADTIGSAMTSTGSNAISAVRTRATGSTVAAGGVASSSDSSPTVNSTSFTDATGLAVTITTSGRPVMLQIVNGSPGANSTVIAGAIAAIATSGSLNATQSIIAFKRGSTVVSTQILHELNPTTLTTFGLSCGGFNFVDQVAAGTYTYQIQAAGSASNVQVNFYHCQLIAYEL